MSEGCKGCGAAVGQYHKRECEYAPWYLTGMGYPPRRVNDMQTRIAPLPTRPAASASDDTQERQT